MNFLIHCMLYSNDSSNPWPLFTSPLRPGTDTAEPEATGVAEEDSKPLESKEEGPTGPTQAEVEVDSANTEKERVEPTKSDEPSGTPAKSTTVPPEATPYFSPSLVAIAETKEWFVLVWDISFRGQIVSKNLVNVFVYI